MIVTLNSERFEVKSRRIRNLTSGGWVTAADGLFVFILNAYYIALENEQ